MSTTIFKSSFCTIFVKTTHYMPLNSKFYGIWQNSISITRSCTWLPNRLTCTRFMWTRGYGPKSVDKFRVKDKIPPSFELVYRNPMTNSVNYAQLTTLCIATALGTFALFPPDNLVQGEFFGPQTETEVLIAYVGLVLAAISIQYVALKFPVRIYSDGPKFIAVTHGVLGSVRVKKVPFNAGDCKKTKHSRFSIWNDVRYDINGKDMYILEHHFKTNADYNRMIGA